MQAAASLRQKAVELLREASALDGLHPYAVAHHHEYGTSIYLFWSAAETPSVTEAVQVLESEFEPKKGESITIGSLAFDEIAGAIPS